MKTQKIIFFLLLLTGLLYSCYEDKSSLNYTLINPINIELGDESTDYSVFAYDTLEIKARHNETCRMSHCPKRFWQDMPEMQGC